MRNVLICLALFAASLSAQAAPTGVTLPEFQRVTLANGAELALLEKHDVPMISLMIAVRGGPLGDPQDKEGTAFLLAELMSKGAGERDARQFAETVDGLGGRLGIGTDAEMLRLSADFLARDRTRMIELAADALLRPHLDAAEFDKVRTRTIRSLIAAKDGDPSGLLGAYAAAWLFGEHPYGRPDSGSEASLGRITLDDVKGYYADQLGGDRLIIVAVGDFKADEMRGELDRAFGDWRAAAKPLPEVAAAPKQTGRRVLLVDKPGATQTYFWLGNVGVARNHDNRAAQNLVNTLFGGRFTSMLNTALRVESGLSYGARSSLSRLSTPGSAAITSFTQTDSTVAAIDLAIAQLEKLHAQPFDDAALDSARRYVLGQFPPTLETHGQLASRLVDLIFHRLGREDVDGYAAAIAAADADAIARAVAVYPGAANLVITLIGDASKIREQVAKYGPLTEMPMSAPDFHPPR